MNQPIYIDMTRINRELAARGIPIWSPRYWAAKGELVGRYVQAQIEGREPPHQSELFDRRMT